MGKIGVHNKKKLLNFIKKYQFFTLKSLFKDVFEDIINEKQWDYEFRSYSHKIQR